MGSYSRDGELFLQVEKFAINVCFPPYYLVKLMVDTAKLSEIDILWVSCPNGLIT